MNQVFRLIALPFRVVGWLYWFWIRAVGQIVLFISTTIITFFLVGIAMIVISVWVSAYQQYHEQQHPTKAVAHRIHHI